MINKRNRIFEKKVTFTEERPSLRTFVQGKTLYFISKRTVDILISFFVSAFVLFFLFPVIAILIKMESRGPVFFVQRRVGRGGRSFLCYKFRTMVVNPEANTCQADENDVRITRVGSFLRRCNVDELPQFFNVLLGDMSIVGPRPHMHSDCAKFSAVIPGYKSRNIIRPGITGLAQSKGFRGPTHDFTSMFHRYQFDAFYVRNASFMMDLRIIRQTAVQTYEAFTDAILAVIPRQSLIYRRGMTILIGFLLMTLMNG